MTRATEMNISRKFSAARAYAGFNVDELADKAEITRTTLYKHIREGTFSVDELQKYAKLFGAEFKCYFVFPDGTRI